MKPMNVYVLAVLAVEAMCSILPLSTPTASPTSAVVAGSLSKGTGGYIVETIGTDPQTVVNELFLAVEADQDISSSTRRRLGYPFSSHLRSNESEVNLHQNQISKIRVLGYLARERVVENGHMHGRRLFDVQQEYIGLVHFDSEADVETLRNSSKVLQIIKNDEIKIAEITANWNLDRIDQTFGMDGIYHPQQELGRNIDIYIVDTGVYQPHAEFRNLSTLRQNESRVIPGKSFADGDDIPETQDCNSHGTHVASIAAGNTFGVARLATIIPVKIMDCSGRGSIWTALQAVSWVIASLKRRGRLAVVNLSFESPANTVIDRAVKDLVNAGAFVTVAAGNGNQDACLTSPAREPSAFTVAALSMDDSKAANSNFGSCVDLYAPGDRIMGAYPLPGKSITKTGTSMASPLAAGVAATLRERFPSYSASRLALELTSMATSVSCFFDGDCRGTAPPGSQILHSLGARSKLSLGKEDIILADDMLNDFNLWSPDLVLPALTISQPTTCFQFSAQLIDANIIPARLSMMISTSAMPLGLSPLLRAGTLKTATMCAAKASDWIIFDSTPSGTTRLNFGGTSNLAGQIAFETPRSLPLSVKRSIQAVINLELLTKQRIRIQLSYNELDPTGNPQTVSIMDTIQAFPAGIKGQPLRISFKGYMTGDLLISDITACAMFRKSLSAKVHRAAK